MSSEVEAAGAVVSAALVGAVIDGKDGHEGAHHASGPCANCGTELSGNFCSNCGQTAHIHRSIGHMVEEVFHGVLHFDTRAWRTLPRLVFQPGKLTYDYIHGQRARYISPLALFLFVVFLMYFVFSLAGGAQVGVGSDDAQSGRAISELTVAKADLVEAEAAVAEAEGALAAAIAGGAPEADIAAAQAVIAAARSKVETLRAATEALRDEFRTSVADQIPIKPPSIPGRETPSAAAEPEPAAPAAKPASEASGGDTYSSESETFFKQVSAAAKRGDIDINLGDKKLNEKVRKKLENPELALYKIQNTAYKYSFLLVPISLPFMWLLFFWKRGVTLFDHCVVVLYSLSFMSLLFVFMSLLGMAPWSTPGLVWTVLVFAPVAHLYVQLKGAYRLSVFSAVWRTVAVGTGAILSLALFVVAIVMLGLTG